MSPSRFWSGSTRIFPGFKSFRMKFFSLIMLVATAAALCGCNTIRGVGEDLSAVGNTLSRAAD